MIKPVYYLQGDSKWRNHNYSAPGERKTISSSGCGVTAAAMIIQTLRPDLKVTPVECAEWSMKHGYKYLNQGTAYGYFTPQMKEYGLSCRMINSSEYRYMPSSVSKDKITKEVRDALQTPGQFVIACMGPGNWTKGGHYIVAYHMDDINVYINDPASTAENRVKNTQDRFFAEAKYFWIIKWGTTNKVQKKGKIYEKHDVTSKRKAVFAGDILYYVKDCKDGWGIVTNDNNVWYVQNRILVEVGKSRFKKSHVTQACWMRHKTNKLSDKVTWVTADAVVEVITHHKYWTKVVYNGYSGWIKSKFLSTEYFDK